jgi:hypothetical protein
MGLSPGLRFGYHSWLSLHNYVAISLGDYQPLKNNKAGGVGNKVESGVGCLCNLETIKNFEIDEKAL